MSSASFASDWNLPRSQLLSECLPCAVFKVRARPFGQAIRSFDQTLSLRFREPSKRYRSTSFSQYINWSYSLRRFRFAICFASASLPAILSGDSSSLPHRNRPKDLIDLFPCQSFLPRKEVIQPHLPIRLPCYDFTPVIGLTFGSWLLAVTSLTSGAPNSHGVTGGVYKARERIHRGMLIRDY